MTFDYKGNIRSPLEPDAYYKLSGSGFLRAHPTKAAVQAKLIAVSRDLPLGTEVEIEKVYRMKRGYEPAARFSAGQLAEVTRLRLVDQGTWYDPKLNGARSPKWKTISRVSRKAGHEDLR